jgi:hypothetical protein
MNKFLRTCVNYASLKLIEKTRGDGYPVVRNAWYSIPLKMIGAEINNLLLTARGGQETRKTFVHLAKCAPG